MAMTKPIPPRLELRQRLYLTARAQRWATWLILVAMVVAMGALTFLLLPAEMRSTEALLKTLFESIVSKPLNASANALGLIAVTLQGIYVALAMRHERLILTPAGIEYRSPMPWFLQAVQPNWSLAWAQIRTATLRGTKSVRGPQALALELEGGARKVKVFPFQWVDPKNYRRLSPWAQLLQQRNIADHVARVQESEVLRYMAIAAPQLTVKHTAQGVVFKLESNRQALVVVIGFFVLLLYALGDSFFLGNEVYVDEPPYHVFVACGMLAALLAGMWMRSAKVPATENVIVSLLFGAALGAALYPGALRVNALTDVDGLRSYEYRLTPEMTLVPLVGGLPALSFPRYSEYWSQFKQGSIHEFQLRRGGLAFYQLNMQPVHLSMREFYEKRHNR